MGVPAAVKAKGHELSAQQKQEQMIQELQKDVQAQKAQDAKNRQIDQTAQIIRDRLNNTIGYYGRLFTSMYSAVNAASADYTGILNMKDLPELADGILDFALDGLTMINPELKCFKLAEKTVETIKQGQEQIKKAQEKAEAIKKLMTVAAANDPNKGEALRMAMVRRFFSKLDAAAERVGIVFAQAMGIVTNWQYNSTGSNVWKDVNRTLQQLAPSSLVTDYLSSHGPYGKPDTSLFADFFLHDMLESYVKANVELRYTTYSLHFPGGDSTHLRPEDPYFDEAGGRYVKVEGLSEEGCKTIYERFGKKGDNASQLSQTQRYPVGRPGDLVSTWGAAFYRNDELQTTYSGQYVNKDRVRGGKLYGY